MMASDAVSVSVRNRLSLSVSTRTRLFLACASAETAAATSEAATATNHHRRQTGGRISNEAVAGDLPGDPSGPTDRTRKRYEPGARFASLTVPCGDGLLQSVSAPSSLY